MVASPFTEASVRALQLAQEESLDYRNRYVGTEHVLLGLFRVEEGVAGQVLRALEVTLADLDEAMYDLYGKDAFMFLRKYGLTPPAKQAIRLAVDEARKLHKKQIGTGHLLLGLVRETRGVAGKVLKSLGMSYEQLYNEIVKVPENPSDITLR